MIAEIETIENGFKSLAGPAGEAQKLLRKLWAHRDEWFSEDASPEEIVLAAPEVALEKLLNYRLVKVEEIPSDRAGIQVAGFMDRSRREIVIAQRAKLEVRRFTLAHEIGHIILHPGTIHHRDRAIDYSDTLTMDPQEYEANAFAAELLMPTRLLRDVFGQCFGGPLVASEADDNLAYFVTSSLSRRVTPGQLKGMTPREFATIVARMTEFGPTIFPPLDKRFAVSTPAIAKRLYELGLVS